MPFLVSQPEFQPPPKPIKRKDPAIAEAAKLQAAALKRRKGRAALNLTGGVAGDAPLSQPEIGGDTLGA